MPHATDIRWCCARACSTWAPHSNPKWLCNTINLHRSACDPNSYQCKMSLHRSVLNITWLSIAASVYACTSIAEPPICGFSGVNSHFWEVYGLFCHYRYRKTSHKLPNNWGDWSSFYWNLEAMPLHHGHRNDDQLPPWIPMEIDVCTPVSSWVFWLVPNTCGGGGERKNKSYGLPTNGTRKKEPYWNCNQQLKMCCQNYPAPPLAFNSGDTCYFCAICIFQKLHYQALSVEVLYSKHTPFSTTLICPPKK